MKIIRVIARGFKTYRDTTVIGEFDDRLNCIVGLNGSGKSSLFQAIIFVLSPDLNSPSLLHEGSTGKSQSGFVEIEFNSPSIQSLRRTISVADPSNGFMVNGNHVSKSDYTTLLQSVGLGGTKKSTSSSTPYFVVEQGRVVSVATISDKQRFDLIKEACGIDVFTVKKTESLKILADTESKREKINEFMSSIDARCGQLERESLELTHYARLEKERDHIEFQIGSVEIENLGTKKIEITSEIEDMKKEAEILENHIVSLSTRKMGLEKNQEGSMEMEEIKIRLSQLGELKGEILGKISLLSNQLVVETESREKSLTAISGLENQLVVVNERKLEVAALIEKDRDEMNRLRGEIGFGKREKSDCLTEIEGIERMGSSVEDLQNRKNQLSLILSSLDLRGRNLDSLRRTKEDELKKIVKDEIPSLENRLETVNEELLRIQSVCDSKRSKIRSVENEKMGLENQLFALKGQRMYSHQKQIEILKNELNVLSSGVFRGDKKLLSVDSREGWISGGIRGLFGDFVKIPSHYRRAVELCSKNVLFNLVIDSDEIADKLVGKFGGPKFGRLTLFPLNRVGDCQRESELVARIESDDAFKEKVKVLSSVISATENEEWVKRLILKFFSKVVIVENVEVGFAVSKKYGVETVTPDGDIISKHLILRSSSNWSAESLTASSVVTCWQQIISIRKKLVAEKSEMNKVLSEIKGLETRLTECREELENLASDVFSIPANLTAEQHSLRKNLEEFGRKKNDFESFEIPTILGEIEELNSEKNRVESEISTVNNQLTSPETGRAVMSQSERGEKLSILKNRISELTAAIESNEQIVGKLVKIISVNQSELVHFIGNKKESLEELIKERKSSIEFVDRNVQKFEQNIVNLKIGELAVVEQELANLVEQESVESEKISQSRIELESVITQLEDFGKQVREISDQIVEKERRLDRLESEITSVRTNSMRQLSSIPTDGFVSTNLSELKSKMISVVKMLNSTQYELLNKNALEQYEKISAERSQLTSRKNEIEESDRAIRSLLDDLNTKEVKMVKDAFVKIKSSFETLFRRVTNGVGKAEIGMDLTEEVSNDTLEISGALRIRVGFPSEPNAALEWKSMAELSGGQRTVVALCFLISLHRANESAPKFFILDEVDAALDSVYRFGIADAVRQESRENDTQFLFTSFRTELASAADRHFLVTMSRGTSRVDSVDLPTALALVNLNEADKSEPTRRTAMVAVRE
jgi:structural maintenance of chromosome 3 (chondroitin sulfate proteoglycan 6)